ncbi:lanthionine synthetase C family protein [Bacteroidota bacterium]
MGNKKIIISDKKLLEKINSKIHEIAHALLNIDAEKLDNGLLTGKAGITIFLFNYSKYSGEQAYAQKGKDILLSVFDSINNGFVQHTFCSGIAGIAYVVEYLAAEGFIEKENTNILGGFDNFLLQNQKLEIDHGNYDYLHAALGPALYFLFSSAGNIEEKTGDFLIELEKQSVKQKDGSINWTGITDEKKGILGVNLGLSHGMASIIAFLALVRKQNICIKKSEELLNAGIKYLIKNIQDHEEYNSYFPNTIEPGKKGEYSRMAWCYGDPGIAWALLLASDSLHDKLLKNKAVEILLHSAKRKDLEKNFVKDACICHGSAGLILIFLQAWRYTGIEEFAEAAKYWAEQSLKMAHHKNSFAGYSLWQGEKGWQPEAGILEGIAGVGLSLMELVSTSQGKWLRALLL